MSYLSAAARLSSAGSEMWAVCPGHPWVRRHRSATTLAWKTRQPEDWPVTRRHGPAAIGRLPDGPGVYRPPGVTSCGITRNSPLAWPEAWLDSDLRNDVGRRGQVRFPRGDEQPRGLRVHPVAARLARCGRRVEPEWRRQAVLGALAAWPGDHAGEAVPAVGQADLAGNIVRLHRGTW